MVKLQSHCWFTILRNFRFSIMSSGIYLAELCMFGYLRILSSSGKNIVEVLVGVTLL